MAKLKTAGVKDGQVKPCLNSQGNVCPCQDHTGEIQMVHGRIMFLSCESRKMHEMPGSPGARKEKRDEA